MIKSLVKKVDTLVTKDNLKSLETKFDTGIQRIETSVESLKSEVREVKDISNELRKSLEFERNRVDEALEEISKKNAELEEKLILLEKHDRKYNILIYGVEKKQNEDISKVVYNFFAEQLELDEEILLSVRVVSDYYN
ncbi:hypothetical protein SNE40_017348 [Patella caerulea]|uniref:Uncharacterized protein n=1 Tax=Patella caerulea TaxID=87958 RepID=A0AAN8JA90_PATCE